MADLLSPSSEQKPTSNRSLLGFFSSPMGSAIGWVIGVASTLFSVWTFYWGSPQRLLTCVVTKQRTAVVVAGQASALKVLYKGREVQGNVSATQIAIWNAGRHDIDASDVLKPLKLSLKGAGRILETKVTHPARDVTGFAVDESQTDAGILTVRWSLLEHNDGALIQVIYEGAVDLPFSIDGIFRGQQSINNSAREQSLFAIILKMSASPMLFYVAYVCIVDVVKAKPGSSERYIYISLASVMLLLIAVFLYFIISEANTPLVPF